MSVGILGSGFGLYGYLPALIGMGEHVLLPRRYQAKLRGRPELCSLDTAVEWVGDDDILVTRATTLVVSRRPSDQVRNVRAALARDGVKRFLLEKPLAPDPIAAIELLTDIERSGCSLRIGFILAYSGWAQDVREWLAQAGTDDTLTIEWRFRAHHYAAGCKTWKGWHSQGGGALRFYGIHLIALMAEVGYRAVEESAVESLDSDDVCAWQAVFSGPRLPRATVRVDSDANVPAFRVTGSGPRSERNLTLASLSDPFDRPTYAYALDRRVDFLRSLYRSLLSDQQPMLSWYRTSIELWQAAERASVTRQRSGSDNGFHS